MNPLEQYSARHDRGGFMVVDAEGADVAWLEPGTCETLVAALMFASQMTNAYLWGLELGGDGEPDPVVEAIPVLDGSGTPVWRIVEAGSTRALYGSLPRDPADGAPPAPVTRLLDHVRERFSAGRIQAEAEAERAAAAGP